MARPRILSIPHESSRKLKQMPRTVNFRAPNEAHYQPMVVVCRSYVATRIPKLLGATIWFSLPAPFLIIGELSSANLPVYLPAQQWRTIQSP
jgi:hypothetical protein